MKAKVEIFRVAKVPFNALELIVRSEKPTHEEIWRVILEKYKPHIDLKIFWPSLPTGDEQPNEDYVNEDSSKIVAIVGMRVMAFDMDRAEIPHAASVEIDPLNAGDIDRLDGSLRSEIQRITEYQADAFPEEFQWRAVYEIQA